MLDNFNADLELGKEAENIVREVLSGLTDEYDFIDISDNSDYYYCGDIVAVNKETGEAKFIEVKNDSRIWETQNVLCEESVYYKDSGYFGQGNMSCDSDYYAIVSRCEHLIYLLDFKRLQEIYKKGEFKIIDHPQQTTYCYLLELCRAKQYGALITILEY